MRWLVVVLIVATACRAERTNHCPSNVTSNCISGEVCSMDRQRGCQVCQCRPWDGTPRSKDPDDEGTPPIPVH
ncbi:MAG TPA: hypothetical protein VMZ53_24550 [Kofleriaceae bacterium]|nr:hypothetical protein [Kofleriaceae bacterium]